MIYIFLPVRYAIVTAFVATISERDLSSIYFPWPITVEMFMSDFQRFLF